MNRRTEKRAAQRRLRCRFAAALAALLLASAGAARGEDASAPPPLPVELSLLSYNLHGLPAWIARDDPAARIPEIGAKMGAYDLVLAQEVWGFHDLLVASARAFPTVLRGNGPPPDLLARLRPGSGGSGLALLTKLQGDAVLDSARAAYGLCAGWIGGANDCFADKGWLRARLRLENGAQVDVVTTHLDAGPGEADHEVRVAQLAALQAALANDAPDRALIVGGDFNLDVDRPRDRAVLATFAAALGLADAGARTTRDEHWVRIDDVLWRSGAGATLALEAAGEAKEFVRANGAPLSDHPAVFARFRVTPAP